MGLSMRIALPMTEETNRHDEEKKDGQASALRIGQMKKDALTLHNPHCMTQETQVRGCR